MFQEKEEQRHGMDRVPRDMESVTVSNETFSRAAIKRARRAVEGSKRIPRRVRARLRQRLFGFRVEELQREREQDATGSATKGSY